jgi:RHS repeat-associated protein
MRRTVVRPAQWASVWSGSGRERTRFRWRWALGLASVLSCSSDQTWDEPGAVEEGALSATDLRVLGFERVSATPSASDWTLASGSSGVLSQATAHTEGARSLGVANVGWAQLVSARIGPLGIVSQKLSLDLLVPGSGSLAWGDVQAFVDAPSLGLHQRSLGQKLLGSTQRGVFQRVEIPIASDVVTKLSSASYSDLSVRVAINVPPTSQPVLVDNLSFWSSGGSGGTGGSGAGGSAGKGGAAGNGGGGSSAGGSGGASGSGGTAGTSGSAGSSAGNGGSGGSGGAGSFQFFIELPRGVDRRTVALASHSAGSLVLNDGVDVVTASGAFASVSSVRGVGRTELGAGADVLHVWSQTDVRLRNDAVVHGDLMTQGLLERFSGARVDGSTRVQMSLEPVQRHAWSVTFASPNLGSVNLEPGQNRTISPGSYAGANLKSGSRLTFSAPGVYTFAGSFFSEPSNTLVFQNGSGAIQVYVRDGLTFRGIISKAQQRANVLLGVAGTQDIPVEGALDGVLVAPRARVTLATRASGHRGSVFAREILHRANTTFRHEPFDPAQFCAAGAACSGLCPCDDGDCDGDDECEPGKVCVLGAGPRHGKPRGTNVCADPVCVTEPSEQCGFPDAVCGSCDNGAPCDGDADCSGGEICGMDRGRGLGLSFPNVCLPPICVSDPVAGGCGTEGSACGPCPCEKSCEAKQCGDDPSDGCGGRCLGFCDNRAAGCEVDGDCPVGNACIIGGGPRIGMPAGTNVCLATACVDPNPERLPCGSLASECGLCPEAPADVCAGRECGEDPTYGVSCGSDCPSGEACIMNRCVPGYAEAALGLTSVSPATREQRVIPAIERLLTPTTVPGALAGSFTVNRQGKATYSVPIVVPPGRAGLEPAISLDYANGAANGLVGIGWSIGGLSSIARCPKIAARNGGMSQPVTDTTSDDLCLDGHPLTLVSGTHFQDGAEYRTEIDTFNRIKMVVEGSEAISFRVEKRDGRIFTYGGNAQSRVHRGIGERARAWALSEIRDRVGNFVEFSYGSFGTNGSIFGVMYRETAELWPVEIAYGGAQSAALTLPHSRRVRFHYSDARFDYLEGNSAAGGRVTRTKLLDRIETFVGDRQVQSYELVHEQAPVSWRRPIVGGGPNRVTQITECSLKSGQKACKRPTAFTYTDQRGLLGSGLDVQAQYSSFKPLERPSLPVDHSRHLIVLDANGDGRDDVFGSTLLLATGSRAEGSEPFTQVAVDLSDIYPAPTQGDVFDFDQDGRDDFLLATDPMFGQGGYRVWVYRSTGSQASPFERQPVGNVAFPSGTNASGRFGIRSFLADVDGDGIKDLFECFGDDRRSAGAPPYAHYQRGLPGGGFDSEFRGQVAMWGTCTLSWAAPEPVFVVDLDGDGTDEVLAWSDYSDIQRWGRYSPKPDGSAEWIPEESLPAELKYAAEDHAVRFVDVNGDGLRDIYAVLGNEEPFLFMNLGRRFDSARVAYGRGDGDPNGGYTREYLNFIQGTTRASTYSAASSLVIDYDGDGREDLIRMFERRGSEPESLSSVWQLDWAAMTPIEASDAGLAYLGADATAADPSGFSGNHFAPQPNVEPAQIPISEWGDVDGDGSVDLLQIAADGRIAVTHGEFGHENLLSSVSDGLSKRIDISYASEQEFSDGVHRTFTKATDCMQTGFSLCDRQHGPLVSRYSTSQYVEELGEALVDRVYTLRYSGARLGLLGRGWLGFDERVIEESFYGTMLERTEIIEDNRTFADGTYPFAGLEQVRLSVSGFAQSPIENWPSRQRISTTKTWNTRLSSAGVPFPYVDYTTVRTWDEIVEIQAELPTVFTDTEVDAYGNVIRDVTSVEWEGTVASETTVETAFDVREGSWLIGLPERRTITHLVVDDGDNRSETRTTDYTFDEFGLLEFLTQEPTASPGSGLRLTTRYERDPALLHSVKTITTFGSWVEDVDVVHNGVRRTTIEYDSALFFPEHVHQHHGTDTCGAANAHTTECQTHDLRYDWRDGALLTRVDPSGVGERFGYDAFGRLVRHEGPTDVLRTTYEDASPALDLVVPVFPKLSVRTVSEGTGAVATKRYDAFGRVVQAQTLGLDGAQVFEETEYLLGDLISRRARPHLPGDVSQGVVTQEFDLRLRPTRQTLSDGTSIEFAYGTVNTLIPAEPPVPGDWRIVGLEPEEVFVGGLLDANQNASFRFHSARGALRRARDGKGASTGYRYGPFDVLLETVDPLGNVASILPDRLGRTLSVSDGNTQDYYQYTVFGEVFQHDDLVGSTRFRYDDLGRVETILAAEGQTSFAYDGPQPNALGRPVSSVGPTGNAVEYQYEPPPASDDPLDNRGLLASIHRIVGGRPFTTSMTYTGGGRFATVTYPPSADEDPEDDDRFVVHYGYAGSGHLRCVSTAPLQGGDCGDDALWRLEESYKGLLIHAERFGNGVRTTYGYEDLTGRLTSIATARGSTSLQDVRHTYYDPNGNLRFRTQTFRDVDGGATTIDEEYRYDAANQLNAILRDGSTQLFSYDDAGNLLSNSALGTYDYSPNDGELPGPHAVRSIERDGDVVMSVRYDLAGNVREREGEGVLGGFQTLEHTSFNLPKQISVGQGTAARHYFYEYDAHQSRVRLGVDRDGDSDFEEERLYVGNGYERQQVEAAGGDIVRHVYKVLVEGRQVAEIERERRGATTTESRRFIHADHLQSSQVVTDEAGEIVRTQRFAPFGLPEEPISGSSGDSAARLRAGFTGHESDVETGLINMRGRMYDPLIGRFLQADPMTDSEQGGIWVNRYAYAANNPLTFTDPSGFRIDPDISSYVSEHESPTELEEMVIVASAPPTARFPDEEKVPTADNNSTAGEQRAAPSPQGTPTSPGGPDYEAYVKSVTAGNGGGGVNQRGGGESSDSSDGVGSMAQSDVEERVAGIETGSEDAQAGNTPGKSDLFDWWHRVNEMAPKGPDNRIACGAPCVALAALVIVGISGDTDKPGTGCKECVLIGVTGAGVAGLGTKALAGRVVLGKFPDYLRMADVMGARRFSVPEKVWKAMTEAEQWAANKKFLDAAVSRGAKFILSNPVKKISEATGHFGKELRYLASRGYRLSSDGAMMVR